MQQLESYVHAKATLQFAIGMHCDKHSVMRVGGRGTWGVEHDVQDFLMTGHWTCTVRYSGRKEALGFSQCTFEMI